MAASNAATTRANGGSSRFTNEWKTAPAAQTANEIHDRLKSACRRPTSRLNSRGSEAARNAADPATAGGYRNATAISSGNPMLIIVPRQSGTGINSTEAITRIQTTRSLVSDPPKVASAWDEAHPRANTVGTTTLASNTRSRTGSRSLALVPGVSSSPFMATDI